MRAVLAASVIFLNTVCLADEMAERAEISELAAAKFHASDYAELERQATQYRSQKSMTSSGGWKLAFFYRGIGVDALDFEKGESEEWKSAFDKFDEWIEAYPRSPTPYVARGNALMQRGWKFRGSGWARETLEQDRQSYVDFTLAAANYLAEHADIGSKDPHWYRTLADAYRHLGVEMGQFRELVDAGLDRYPDYDEIYFVSAGYLSPKWGGSAEMVEAFARDAVERTTAARGFAIYARIYWAAGRQANRKYLFQESHASWSDVTKGMDDILRRYPSQWNINHFAKFACFMNDRKSMKRYLEMIEEPIIEKAWGGIPLNYQKCRLNASLEPSPNIAMP